jgi:hypothetical protein
MTLLPMARWMQDEKNDDAFVQSAGGLLFPRSNVGAGAFW